MHIKRDIRQVLYDTSRLISLYWYFDTPTGSYCASIDIRRFGD